VEKPKQPPGASAADLIFWQVSGALIGASAGWAFGARAFGLHAEAIAVAVLAGLGIGGALGMLQGFERARRADAVWHFTEALDSAKQRPELWRQPHGVDGQARAAAEAVRPPCGSDRPAD
jgi:hypothetical protein